MGAVFNLDHGKLAGDARFTAIARELGRQTKIDSSETFNSYCRAACRLWEQYFGNSSIGKTSAQFDQLVMRLDRDGENVIQTSWGGVVITLHEHPRVEKFLVVHTGGYLALEKHEKKDERLEVKEGAGLVLWRRGPNDPLTVESLERGRQFHFEPGMEHCVIGTENLLVFERSTDPKGMDQDLVFIYEPVGVAKPEENVQRSTSNVQRPMPR
jgi:hypothetical protein